MRFNFKKIAAIGTSVLLAGMTTGFAAAAAFPAPFVSGGAANVAIVYGSNAATLDYTDAQSIQSALAAYTSPSGVVATPSGSIPLDLNGPNKIWLNTTLTTAKSIFGATDLPNVLGSTTFSGAQTATVTQYIYLGSGVVGSGSNSDNSNKVIFEKMAQGISPGGSVDPVAGVSIGYSPNAPFYNISVGFSQPVNFTASASQGQTLTLFGSQYIVSSSTSTSNGLVLFGSGSNPTLTQGATTSVTIGGQSYTIGLGSVSTTAAQVSVNNVTGNVNVGSTTTVNGVSIGVTNVYPSSGVAPASATLLIGANQITLANATQVQTGNSNTPVQGTYVTLNGPVTSSSGFNIAVYAPSVINSTIAKGNAFIDPVFGTFQISNAGLNIPASTNVTTGKDIIKVAPSGTNALQLSLTDLNNYSLSGFTYALNNSGYWNLSSITPGWLIYPYEMANLSLNSYTLTGTGSSGQLEGHILQLQQMSNSSGSSTTYSPSSDWVSFYDVLSGQTYKFTGTSTAGIAQYVIDGRQYTVNFNWYSLTQQGWAELKFPSADEGGTGTAATQFVLYPTISSAGAIETGLYQPLNLSLNNFDGLGNNVSSLNLPNGNGFSTINFVYAGNATIGGTANWTITGAQGVVGSPLLTGINGTVIQNTVNVTVGKLTYMFASNATSAAGVINGGSNAGVNRTMVYLLKPGTNSPINEPAVVVFEPKDNAGNYNAVVIDSTNTPSGTASNPVGVSNVYFTGNAFTNAGAGIQLFSNTNYYQFMDYWGTVVNLDKTTTSQAIATVYAPTVQAYEQLYLGPTGALTSTGGTQAGAPIVKDSQISSVYNNNLVIVGGSCINSAAATLVGGAKCGPDWTAATKGPNDQGVGPNQFLIQSFNSNLNAAGLVALLVAGYEAADTLNAATYLTTQKPDTAFGKKYIGTTSSSAQTYVSS